MNKEIKLPVCPVYPAIPSPVYLGEFYRTDLIEELKSFEPTSKSRFNSRIELRHNSCGGVSVYFHPNLIKDQVKLLKQYNKCMTKYQIDLCKLQIENEKQKIKELQGKK